MTPIIKYLTGSFSPKSDEEAQAVRRRATKFTMVADKLYKMGRATPMLRCLGEEEIELVLIEVHEGVCGSLAGGEVTQGRLLLADNVARLHRLRKKV